MSAPLKACTVVVHDRNDTAHELDVTAETPYEAVAQALAAARGHEWVGGIGRELTTITCTGPVIGDEFVCFRAKSGKRDNDNIIKCRALQSPQLSLECGSARFSSVSSAVSPPIESVQSPCSVAASRRAQFSQLA